jgi:hypothetical protein
VTPDRTRLRWLAALMIAIAAVGLIAVRIVAGSGPVA